MFTRIATILKRLMGCQSTAPSAQTATIPSNSANNLLVTSGQQCQDAPAPAKSKPKRKPKAAQPTTAVASRKQTQKYAQQAPGQDGSQQAIPASKTRRPAKQAQTTKRKAVASTTPAKKRTPSKTLAPTRTVSKSKARGS